MTTTKTEAEVVDDITFIPNDDFESAREQDFEQIDVELYAAEEGREAVRTRGEAAASFLRAVEEGRLLTFEGEQFLFKRLNFLRFRAHALQVALRAQRRPKKRDLREIDRLLREAQESREEIARANLRLVMSIARKHARSVDEFDDFVAEANAILLNAIDKFDFARGYRFSTYATHAIQRHFFRMIERSNKRRGVETSGSDFALRMAAQKENEGPDLGEVLTAATAIVDRIDDVLDQREKHIVLGRFGLDGTNETKTLRVLGEEIGISKERVRQLLQQSLEKLTSVAQPFESTFAPD